MVGGLELVLKPEDYVDRERQAKTGVCYFMANERYGEFNIGLFGSLLMYRHILRDFMIKMITSINSINV
jgi:hypothetical protein